MKRLQTSIHVAQVWIYQHGDWSVIFSSFHTDRIGNSKWGMHSFSQHLLRYKKHTTMDMHHFRVVFYVFALLETSTFQGQPNCSHQYILTHWAPAPGVKCFELCLCTRFWCFRTRSSQREHALRLQLYRGKMGTHDLPLKVSNEACARWTGTSQV